MRRPIPPSMAMPVLVEFDLQVYAVQLLQFCAMPGLIYFAVPNGEARSPRTGARLKRMGLQRGVADLAFVLPGSGRAAFLELKSAHGRLTPEQVIFGDKVISAGGLYAVANSPESVRSILEAWKAIRTEAVVRRAAA